MTRAALIFGAALVLAMPAAAETVAIVNARIETVGPQGAIPSGVILLKDGKIAAVGPQVATPAGARIVDAGGGVVTPGFIAPSTDLGVTEVGSVRQTSDDGSGGSLSAGFDIQYGVNPASTLIPLARQSGVTRAVLTPVLSGGGGGHNDDGDVEMTAGGGDHAGDPSLFGGQAAIITLAAGATDPVIRARMAVTLDLGEDGAQNAGGSRGATLVLVRSALDDARQYSKNRAAYERGAVRAYGLSRPDLEALVPVVEGRTPLLIRVHRAADIRQALKLAAEQKVKIILEGAEEGWMVAWEIAAAGVPVIVDSEANLPQSFETLGARLDNAARLKAAGVLVTLTGSRDFNSLRQARLNAGTAVANGLTNADALAALTINPARTYGFADRAGSLEVGKDADLVVWNGDPMETTSWPTAVFIGGVQQPETTRGLELRDRYAKPADGYPPAYH